MRVDSMLRCPAWAWTASRDIPASRSRVRQGWRGLWPVGGAVVDAGAAASAADDFVDAGERERLTTARAFEDEEHTRCCCIRGAFVVEVVGECSEERGRHRDDAVMAAFAFGDGDLAVSERDIGQV